MSCASCNAALRCRQARRQYVRSSVAVVPLDTVLLMRVQPCRYLWPHKLCYLLEGERAVLITCDDAPEHSPVPHLAASRRGHPLGVESALYAPHAVTLGGHAEDPLYRLYLRLVDHQGVVVSVEPEAVLGGWGDTPPLPGLAELAPLGPLGYLLALPPRYYIHDAVS